MSSRERKSLHPDLSLEAVVEGEDKIEDARLLTGGTELLLVDRAGQAESEVEGDRPFVAVAKKQMLGSAISQRLKKWATGRRAYS